jgi:hypothetical protein
MKINETIRKDGLRIVTCYVPHKKSVFAELVARVGHAYDPSDKPGLLRVRKDVQRMICYHLRQEILWTITQELVH